MAKSERRDRVASGPKMDVPGDARLYVRSRRQELEWSQEELAAKVGVSNGTISNLETGGRTGHDQCYKRVFAEVMRVLKAGHAVDTNPDRFRRAVEKLLDLDEAGWAIAEGMLELLPSRNPSTSTQ